MSRASGLVPSPFGFPFPQGGWLRDGRQGALKLRWKGAAGLAGQSVELVRLAAPSRKGKRRKRRLVTRLYMLLQFTKHSETTMADSTSRFGFVAFAETWNGRMAMLGFVIGVATELLTGQGILSQIGLG